MKKQFFFSVNDGISFALLPEADQWAVETSQKLNVMFSGNPARKYNNYQNKSSEEEESDEPVDPEAQEDEDDAPVDDEADDDENRIVKPRKLTEVERLSAVVRAIDSDCFIVPIGAFYMAATGEICRNLEFRGLTAEQARKLESYGLFRDAQQESTLLRIRKAGLSNNFEFLDTIVSTRPGESSFRLGCEYDSFSLISETWSLQTDDSQLNVRLRSLLWPGYEFQLDAACGTGVPSVAEAPASQSQSSAAQLASLSMSQQQRCGGAYFGTGLFNKDFAFMA